MSRSSFFTAETPTEVSLAMTPPIAAGRRGRTSDGTASMKLHALVDQWTRDYILHRAESESSRATTPTVGSPHDALSVLQALTEIAMRYKSRPVGSQPDDTNILLHAMRERRPEQTYKDVLDSLHMARVQFRQRQIHVLTILQTNGHSSCQWKDHFLDNLDEVLETVRQCAPPRDSKSPTPPSTVVTMANGRTRFTDEDLVYAVNTAKHLARGGVLPLKAELSVALAAKVSSFACKFCNHRHWNT